MVDAPTYRAREERTNLQEQGILFDGSWMPATIKQVLHLLPQAGVYPPRSESAPLQFLERVTAQNGVLITLYEVMRSDWGFAVRGLEQQEVIRELEAVLSHLAVQK